MYKNFSLSPKALTFLKDFLVALGYDVSGELDFEPDEIKEKKLNVKYEADDGRTWGDVQKFRPYSPPKKNITKPTKK
jgi:hypothetical protein